MPSAAVSAMFGKIATAKPTLGSSIIKDGRYILEIDKLMIETKTGGTFFIAEMIVREAQPLVEGVQPNAVGSKASYVQNLDKHQSAPGNVKAFLLSLYDEKEPGDPLEAAKFSAEFANAVEFSVGNSQPAKGMLIACETYHKLTRDGKKDLTLYRWTPVPANSATEVQARRQALESAEKVA
jgi:hypothetical protein